MQVTAFFAGHAPVNCVRLRRHANSKQFKGSAFVEFASVEEAEKVGGSWQDAGLQQGWRGQRA